MMRGFIAELTKLSAMRSFWISTSRALGRRWLPGQLHETNGVTRDGEFHGRAAACDLQVSGALRNGQIGRLFKLPVLFGSGLDRRTHRGHAV